MRVPVPEAADSGHFEPTLEQSEASLRRTQRTCYICSGVHSSSCDECDVVCLDFVLAGQESRAVNESHFDADDDGYV